MIELSLHNVPLSQLVSENREKGILGYLIFIRWVEETADYIRSLDTNHLISTGNEGTAGCIGSAETYLDIHRLWKTLTT